MLFFSEQSIFSGASENTYVMAICQPRYREAGKIRYRTERANAQEQRRVTP